MTSPSDLGELEKRLDYQFSNRRLLEQALTHSSARGQAGVSHDNEQLEFLGDRVLGLAIAELLHRRFPNESEGTMARRYNRLVRREACAAVGEELDLGAFLVLGEGEAGSGGRKKHTILADACEAVLAAVFLDGGFRSARNVVKACWTDRILEDEEVRADAKSALQEWAQGRGLDLPRYAEIERKGPDHAPTFVAEVRIEGLSPTRGEGSSKRAAEQQAAEVFLEREGIR